jgi:hypothetical protein
VEEENKDPDQTLSLSYILHYGGKETTWTETCAIDLHKSQMINLEYMLGSSDQSIILEVNAISARNSVPVTHKTRVRFEMHSVLEKTI